MLFYEKSNTKVRQKYHESMLLFSVTIFHKKKK